MTFGIVSYRLHGLDKGRREKTFLDVKEIKKSLLCGELLAIDDYLWSKGQRVHVNLGAKMLLPILNMILVIVRGSQNC